MTLIAAGTRVPYRVTYLAMTAPAQDAPPDLPPGARLDQAIAPPPWYFLALYDAVGRDHEWRDKHLEDPETLRAFVQHPLVELWTLVQDGWPQGFFQLDFRDPGTCDLAYFGLVPEALGKGLGGALLRIALAKGWARDGVARMTVNTCTLDHPRALGMYLRAGFVPLRTEDRTRPLSRPRAPSPQL